MKYYEKIKEFVEGEIDDYSYFKLKEIRLNTCFGNDDKDEYYYVDIETNSEREKTLCFHYDGEKDKLEIELGEDNYEEVNDYSWRIKYFWMALLEW